MVRRVAAMVGALVLAPAAAGCEGGWAPGSAPDRVARMRDDPDPGDASMREVDEVLVAWVERCGVTRVEADLYAEEYGDAWARGGFRHAWQHLYPPQREMLQRCLRQHYVTLGTAAQDADPGFIATQIQAAARQRYPTGSGLFRYWFFSSWWVLLLAAAIVGVVAWRLWRWAMAPKRALRQSQVDIRQKEEAGS